jgi:DNA-binding winged helix-turn-helix (wHTH) protein
VWEVRHDTASNVVEAHIKKLREKLGEYAWLIETVRGVGYRLVTAAMRDYSAQVNVAGQQLDHTTV